MELWPTGRARCERRWPCSEDRGTPTAPSSRRSTGTPPTAGRGTRLGRKRKEERKEIIYMQCTGPKNKKYMHTPTRRHQSIVLLLFNTGLHKSILLTTAVTLSYNSCGCFLWRINGSWCTNMAAACNVSYTGSSTINMVLFT